MTGVFHLRYNAHDKKVREIWFLRQLSKDEAARKVASIRLLQSDYAELAERTK